jgi:tRNA(Ile)-lysidine synthase
MSASVSEALPAQLAAEGLLERGRPVIVLLSGGRDSMCLLDVAVRVRGLDGLQALHVNYGLRPEADGDQAACAELCALLGAPLAVHRPGAPPPRGNLQAWARSERYQAAAMRAAALGPACVVATGHTASDQLETILYRLASSPSRRALLGMRARAGVVVRPLLGIDRSATSAYCRERGLPFREDATNDTDRYARGRVRTELIPALRRVHPGAERNIVALAELLREEAEVLDGIVDGVLEGRSEVSRSVLRSLPPAVARLVVQRLADAAAGGLAPGAAGRTSEILALESGALDIGSSVRVLVQGGIVSFGRTPPLARGRAEPA